MDETLKPASGPNVCHSMTYGCDRLSRLLTENGMKNGSPIVNNTEVYDGAGNHTQKDTVSYTYHPDSDKLLSDVTLTYQYDQNGTVVSQDDDLFSYDFDNRIKAAQALGQTTDFVYDPDGNRLKKEVDQSVEVQYIVDTNRAVPEVLVELDASENVTSVYVYGDDLICRHPGPNATRTYYYFSDAIGSTRLVTDAPGNVENRYTDDAFGSTLASECQENVENDRLFTSETYTLRPGSCTSAPGITILSLAGSRPLIPSMECRPVPRTLHPYSYCGSDPVNSTDPSGEVTLIPAAWHTGTSKMFIWQSSTCTVWIVIGRCLAAAPRPLSRITIRERFTK